MTSLLELDGGMPDEADVNIASKGPRWQRTHNPRFLGDRAHPEVPAKPKHRRIGKMQRQARKASRG